MLASGRARGQGAISMTGRGLGRAAGAAIVGLAASWLSAAPVLAAPPAAGQPAPNFALTTQQSDRVWLTQLRGRVVVLAFGCASCGACPGLLERLADLEHGLGDAPGRRVFFAVVTVDPARDTPAALRAFGRAHGLRVPAWILLTEERRGEVDAVARLYGVGVRRQGDRVEADCAVSLIDGAGVIRSRYAPGALDGLARDVHALLD
jgi:protein SCO1